MEFFRTPDERFENLEGYPFAPNYVFLSDCEGGELRMHYLDEGPVDGEVVVCLHGQPTWSYLYRKMVPVLVKAGYRVIVPDLVGFGRSDKPTKRSNHTVQRHIGWIVELIEQLDLQNITFFGQDWGGLIGLCAVVDTPDRFARVVAANTGLPVGVPEAMNDFAHQYYDSIPLVNANEMAINLVKNENGLGFLYWVKWCAETPDLDVPFVVRSSVMHGLTEGEQKAYAAPFPDENYKAAPRQFPSNVPIMSDNPAVPLFKEAWKFFEAFKKPFICIFGDSDPVTAGSDNELIRRIPGAQDQKHQQLKGVGHFLQEDAGPEVAELMAGFMQDNPVGLGS